MPLLSDIASNKKFAWFVEPLPKEAAILEVGCGDGAMAKRARQAGWTRYATLDLRDVGADFTGDILRYRELGLKEASFDAIIAFEVVEHVHCFREFHDLLKPGGLLLLTSPIPERDWILQILEFAGLNQKRTSPHDHLIHFKRIPFFTIEKYKTPAGLAQWGKLRRID